MELVYCLQAAGFSGMSKPLTLEEVREDAAQGDERAVKSLADLGRLSEDKRPLATVAVLHRLATARGRAQYIDPDSGFSVFTATFLKQRACCGYSCRHCPHLEEKCKESKVSLSSDW